MSKLYIFNLVNHSREPITIFGCGEGPLERLADKKSEWRASQLSCIFIMGKELEHMSIVVIGT